MNKLVCKYHDIYSGFSEVEPLMLDEDPADSRTSFMELDIITKALNRIERKVKFGIPSWPICGNGGIVTLNRFSIDRKTKTVNGHWDCTCQHIDEWDEDTIEMDS